jgi:signal transduction histidine kinase
LFFALVTNSFYLYPIKKYSMGIVEVLQSGPGFFRFRNLSLRQRLPLLICLLLLCIIATFGWISYLGVKRAALEVGDERLLTLTGQLSSMFEQSANGALAETKAAAGKEVVRKYLESGGSQCRREATEALQALRKKDSLILLAELIDSGHRVVLDTGKQGIRINANTDSVLSQSIIRSDSAGVGKFYSQGDSIYYPVIALVKDRGKVIGYVLRWHLVQVTPKAIEQLSQLVGTRATFYFGNDDGKFWTDLIKPVQGPPYGEQNKQGVLEYSRAPGNPVLAAVKPIGNTRWVVLVEFPKKIVLEAASRFLYWILIAGVLLITAGIAAAWIISRNIIRPIKELETAVSSIAGGNYSLSVDVEREDEIGKLAHAFNTMAAQVSHAHAGLERKIMEVGRMNEQLRNLSVHLQNIREEERVHIAREMHDELGQLLTCFKMDMVWLGKKTADQADEITQKISGTVALVDEAIRFVRKLASELRPAILDYLGLVAALQWQSDEFVKRFNIETAFHSEIKELEISPLIATGLFRMYQESLTNVARHAQAKRVIATLALNGDQLFLSVMDDGKGFAMNGTGPSKTLGLLGMQERAIMLGGTLEIISAPGKGTSVLIKIPSHGSSLASKN